MKDSTHLRNLEYDTPCGLFCPLGTSAVVREGPGQSGLVDGLLEQHDNANEMGGRHGGYGETWRIWGQSFGWLPRREGGTERRGAVICGTRKQPSPRLTRFSGIQIQSVARRHPLQTHEPGSSVEAEPSLPTTHGPNQQPPASLWERGTSRSLSTRTQKCLSSAVPSCSGAVYCTEQRRRLMTPVVERGCRSDRQRDPGRLQLMHTMEAVNWGGLVKV